MKEEEKVLVKSTLKIKYDKLKKAGYKLDYGSKSEEYIDIYFVKKLDENISTTISINEKTVTKRLHGGSFDNSGIEPLTCEEIIGIADILSQLK